MEIFIKNIKKETINFYKFLRISKSLSLFLSFLSGILLGLPFFDGRLWIFAWFGFVPLFFALRGKSKGRAFLLSYLTGVIFWAGTIYWLIHVTLLGQILLILYLSLYFGFFGLFVFASRQPPGAIRLFFIPSLWVFLEYLRAHLFSGFGWAFLGYSQYLNLPVIQIADIFGVWGVSFLVMMVNLALWELMIVTSHKSQVTSHRWNFSFLFPFFCLLFSLAYGFYKLYRTPNPPAVNGAGEPRTTLKISVIQGNIPQELKWDKGSQPLILDRYAQLSQKAALEKPDLIIWPEAASPGFIGAAEDDWLSGHIFAVPKETGIPLLLGSVVRENKNYFNSALLIDRQGKIAGRYDKLHLVPFGEYVPLKKLFPFLETIVPIGDFTSGDSYTLFSLSPAAGVAGPVRNYRAIRKEKEVSDGAGAKFGVLICFEDTIPELSRNFVKKGADFLVNITNDGWFKETKAPYQHLAASVFRAVENRVPLVRAANTGVSCFIDSRGRIKAKLTENGKDIFVPGTKTETIFI